MGRYDDILHQAPPKSKNPMSLSDRAAQFAPFAALTGFEDAVSETARLTDAPPEVDEYTAEQISRMLLLVANDPAAGEKMAVTYFLPDDKKAGGSYKTSVGIRKLRSDEHVLLLQDGTRIPINRIVSVSFVT